MERVVNESTVEALEVMQEKMDRFLELVYCNMFQKQFKIDSKWVRIYQNMSKFIEWLKNGKTCFIIGQEWCRECIQTTQELRMLSTVTLYCQVAKIVMNLCSQL